MAGQRVIRLVAGLCVLPPALLHGQRVVGTEAWRWNAFGPAEGLPSGRVNDVAEALDGTMWVATDAGLAWFDGFVWHPVTADQGAPASPGGTLVPLPQAGVLAVLHGRLFRGDTSGFHEIPVRVPKAQLVAGGPSDTTAQPVESVAMLGPDDLVVIVPAVGEPEPRKALVRVRDGHAEVVPAPLPLGRWATLFTTRSGAVYLSAGGAVFRWTSGEWRRTRSIPGGRGVLSALAENADGEGIGFVNDPESERGLIEWSASGAARRVDSEGLIPAVGLDLGPFGTAAVIYASGHLRLRERGRWSDYPSLPPQLRRAARAVRFARDGSTWFGGEDGVYVYRSATRRWAGWSFPFPDQRARINAVLVRATGAVWTGTGDGVVIYRPDRTEPESIREAAGVALGVVTGLAEDADGTVWVTSGATFPGALRWDGRSWRHVGPADGLAAPRVHRVVLDRRGRPWFLGLGGPTDLAGGPGAFVLTDDGRFERWGVEEGLPSGRVYGFAEAPDGSRWFATLGGVSRWRDGTWTHWTRWRGTIPDGSTVNVALRPRSLAVGPDGVWIGDRALGVGFVDGNDSLRFHLRGDGLASTEIRDVQVDEDGVVWASTARGVCFLTTDRTVWQCLGPGVGLATGNVWPIALSREGIYVGTQGEGLQVLSRAEAADPAPRVVMAPPIVEGRSVRVRWQAFAFGGAVPSATLLTRHRVDGGPWSRWTLEREHSLTGSQAGRHVVQVQARGLFGQYDEEGTTAAVVVPLPLVLRPAFAVPVGSLLAALTVLVTIGFQHRRRSVRVLRASEARFRALGEAAFEGIGFLGEGTVVDVNERLAEMLGYEREQLIGSDLDRLVASRSLDTLHQLQPIMRQRLPSDGPVRVQLWARRNDGSEFPAEVQAKVMPLGADFVRVVAVRDISERYEADAALRRSEQKFAKAFWASPDAIDIAREADARFIEVNEAFVRLSGRSRDQVIGRSGAELGLWEDDAARETYWATLRHEGHVRGYECRLRGADGRFRDCVISAERLEIGGESCVLALTRDVTALKQAVAALRMTQFSVDHAAEAVLWIDPDGRIGYANASAAASLGYDPGALVEISILDVTDTWTAASWREFWALVRRQGATLRVCTLRTRRGQTFPAEILCHHIAAEGHEHLVMGARDISERVAAEQAVLASEAKFATAFRSSPSGMVLLRAADGVLLEVNDAFLRLTRQRRSTLTARRAGSLGVWPDEPAWEAFRDRVVADGSLAGDELRLDTGRGERIVLLSAESLEVAGERCLLCAFQDVTEQERARRASEDHRQALRTLSRDLMAAQEAERARISRELHDEIGQALAAVKLNLQAIGRLTADEGITSQVRDGVAVVDSTVLEVRNLSRDLRPSVLDDLGLTAALEWYLGRSAERSGLTIAFAPQPGLPRAPREVETACYRIAQEALTNVLRHAEASRVDVSVAVEGPYLTLVVRDDGLGFDVAAQSGGDGDDPHLGLVGMRERAGNVGGEIAIESVPGSGTVVRARFDITGLPDRRDTVGAPGSAA